MDIRRGNCIFGTPLLVRAVSPTEFEGATAEELEAWRMTYLPPKLTNTAPDLVVYVGLKFINSSPPAIGNQLDTNSELRGEAGKELVNSPGKTKTGQALLAGVGRSFC
jgi:hypothetical protein